MQGRNFIIVAAAIFLGLIAVVLGNAYFSGFERKQEQVAEAQKLARIVVASQDVAFGTQLSPQNLRLTNWPAQSVPEGAFTTIEALTGAKRVALRPIVAGEPVLPSRISGNDGRASLSTNLPAGKFAYTIPINDVSGVGGYARPGDVVDVLLTRPIPGDGAGANDKMTDVIIEAAPVLGMDLVSDSTQTKPESAKTATLEVTAIDAQKLALAIQLGQLSLALRNITNEEQSVRPTILPRHLSTTNFSMRRTMPSSAPAAPAPVRVSAPAKPATGGAARPRVSGPSMTVVRGSTSSDYEVQRGI